MTSIDLLKTLIKLKNPRKDESAVKNIQSFLQNLNDPVSAEILLEQFITSNVPDASAKLQEVYPQADLTLFSKDVYNTLLPVAKLMYSQEQNGIAEEHAYKLAVIFNDTNKALRYVQQFAATHPNSAQVMHDACIFSLPTGVWDLKVWRKIAQVNLTDNEFRTKILPQVSALEKLIKTSTAEQDHRLADINQQIKQINNQIKTQGIVETNSNTNINPLHQQLQSLQAKSKELSLGRASPEAIKRQLQKITDLNVAAKKLKRKHGTLSFEEKAIYRAKIKELHEERLNLIKMGITFNENLSLGMLQAFRKKYVSESSEAYNIFLQNGLTETDYRDKFLLLDRKDDDNEIPPITIDGETVGHPGYYLMKVPVLDELPAARAACFGKLTDCCQSLSGEAGEPCTINGLTSPHAGFYVLCKGDINNPKIQDPVIGQTWAWRSQNNAIVFDSIEITSEPVIAEKFFQNLAQKLVESGHTHKVCCGATSGISNQVGFWEPSLKREEFKDYSGYCDSTRQLLVYDSAFPFYLYGKNQQITEKTNALLEQEQQENSPLTSKPTLLRILNKTVLKESSTNYSTALTRQINHLYSQPQDQAELQKIQTIIKSYLDKNLPENERIILLENNPFLLNILHDGYSPLHWAAANGSIALIGKILKLSPGILESKDFSGNTALSIAVQHSHLDAVQFLINQGANVNIQNTSGMTPLMFNIKEKERNGDVTLAIGNLLLKQGALIDAKDFSGKTALMYAMTYENADMLIKHGASATATDNSGKPPLHHIATGENGVVQVLLENGADINAIDKEGNTALIYLVQSAPLNASQEIIDVMDRLISQGADIHIEGKKGDALIHAIKNNNFGFINLLAEEGANTTSVRRSINASPLQLIKNKPAHLQKTFETHIGDTSDYNFPSFKSTLKFVAQGITDFEPLPVKKLSHMVKHNKDLISVEKKYNFSILEMYLSFQSPKAELVYDHIDDKNHFNYLIKYGIMIKDGDSLLEKAIANEHWAIAQSLIENDIKPTIGLSERLLATQMEVNTNPVSLKAFIDFLQKYELAHKNTAAVSPSTAQQSNQAQSLKTSPILTSKGAKRQTTNENTPLGAAHPNIQPAASPYQDKARPLTKPQKKKPR
jgi:ankyrin repeat protein